jgi:hypothetical protein
VGVAGGAGELARYWGGGGVCCGGCVWQGGAVGAAGR